MKKIFSALAIMLLVCFIFGCLEISPDTETVLLKTTARAAGYKLAKEKPEFAKVVIPQAKILLAAASGDQTQFVNALFPAAVALLQKQIDDPILAASLVDAVSLIKVDATVSAQSEQIMVAVQGFIEGLILGGGGGGS